MAFVGAREAAWLVCVTCERNLVVLVEGSCCDDDDDDDVFSYGIRLDAMVLSFAPRGIAPLGPFVVVDRDAACLVLTRCRLSDRLSCTGPRRCGLLDRQRGL